MNRLALPKYASMFMVAFFLTFASCTESGTEGNDEAQQSIDNEAAVQLAWDEFKEASLSGKGEVAANRVTAATHENYDEIRLLALGATRDELESHVLMTRIAVLGMRLRIPADELRAMTGRDLFVHAVDQGWIGKNSATDEDIESITVTGDHARAMVTKSGEQTGQYLHFIREDGEWRLDMLQMMTLATVAFDRMLTESGMAEDEFTKRVIEATTGMVVTDSLWTPPDSE